MRLGRLIPLFCLLAPLAVPATAAADDFQTVFQDYKDNGRLDGCYKAYQLYNAGKQIPPDIEQYAPGFGDALSAGQSGCNRGGTGQQPAEEPVAPVSAGTPGPGAPSAQKRKTVKEPPAPKQVPEPVLAKLPQPNLGPATSGVSSETPGGLIVLLVAAAAALLMALAWAIAWFMGWSPERFTKPLTAAFTDLFSRR